MSEVERLLRRELERLAPANETPGSDWRAVRRAARWRPTPRRLALALVFAVAAVVAPTFALSASVRDLFGFGEAPHPDYGRARLAVSTPIPGGRVARVWVAPSKEGGECEFVTLDPVGPPPQPTRMTGGGACTLGKTQLHGRLTWSFSHGRDQTPIIHGRVGKKQAAGVELRWHGGGQLLAYAHGFFVAAAPALNDPPFRLLPYDVVVLDAVGRAIARSRIPTSFLYSDWKRVEPQLHRYRVLHGCSTTVLWQCKSR
jgi:hypothetical protein